MKFPRPAVLTWLSAFYIFLSGTYLLRFIYSVQPAPVNLLIPTWYLPVSGFVWGLVFLFEAVLFWIPRRWIPALLRYSGAAYLFWIWAERLLLSHSQYAIRSTPFVVLVTIIMYALLWFTLSLKNVRFFFLQSSLNGDP